METILIEHDYPYWFEEVLQKLEDAFDSTDSKHRALMWLYRKKVQSSFGSSLQNMLRENDFISIVLSGCMLSK